MSTRRTVLAGGVTVLSAGVAGGLQSLRELGTTDQGPEWFPAGPATPPERPDEVTPSTAAAYVESYRYRRAYNSGQTTGAQRLALSCPAAPVGRTSSGIVVFSRSCYGTRTTRQTTESLTVPPAMFFVPFADAAPQRLLVDADTQQRREPSPYASTDPSENVIAPATGGVSLTVGSFATSTHPLHVRLVHLPTQSVVLDREETMDGRSTHQYPDLAVRQGSYRLTIQSAGTTNTVTVELTPESHRSAIELPTLTAVCTRDAALVSDALAYDQFQS